MIEQQNRQRETIQRFLQSIKKVDGRYVVTEDYKPQGKITKELSGLLRRRFPELSEKDFETKDCYLIGSPICNLKSITIYSLSGKP